MSAAMDVCSHRNSPRTCGQCLFLELANRAGDVDVSALASFDPPPSPTHYPVTTSFWRGVWDLSRLTRPLKSACDWKALDKPLASFAAPTCDGCRAYKAVLQRLGKIK
jgi:hypothetical protein